MPWSPSCRRWGGAPRPRRRRPRMPEQHHLIVGPVITEKTSAAFQARKEYAFRVQPQATKRQLRARSPLVLRGRREALHPRPKGLAVGDTVVSGPGSDIRVGNAMPLFEIPLGTTVHSVELKIGRGGQLARSAGTGVQVVAKEGNYVTLRLRSTEMRMVRGECLATIGEVSNAEHELLSIGKAGKSRWLGRMPRVRGVAMNPVDHPLGGGEGKTSGGRPPTNPWGKVEGKKTRHKKKPSTKLIVRGRKRGKATQ